MTQRLLAPVVLGLILGVTGLAEAQFPFTTVDVPFPGATRTAVNGNSTDAMVGEFDDSDGNTHTHGFLFSKGNFTQIDVPGSVYTTVNGINANEDMSGIYVDGPGRTHGYFLSNGVFTTLDPPGSVLSIAEFLNAQGQVVGEYGDASGTGHGYIWGEGHFIRFDVPGATFSRGYGINDWGDVVGDYVDADGRHGFRKIKGAFTTLDAPDSVYTIAEGINDAGKIVGFFGDSADHIHSFVWSYGSYTVIDVADSTDTEIYSINAKGEIVGTYYDADGVGHGLVASIAIATPLPNPPFTTGGFVPPDSDVYKQEVAVGKLLSKYAVSKTKCDQKAVIALQVAYEPPGAPEVPAVQADWTECQAKVLLKYEVTRDKLLLKGTPACLDQAGIDAIKAQLDTQIGRLGAVVYCDGDTIAPDPVTGLNIPDFKIQASGEVSAAKVLTKTGVYAGKCYSLALKYAFTLGGTIPPEILAQVAACFTKASDLGLAGMAKLDQTQKLPACLPLAGANALVVGATVDLSGQFNDETYCAE